MAARAFRRVAHDGTTGPALERRSGFVGLGDGKPPGLAGAIRRHDRCDGGIDRLGPAAAAQLQRQAVGDERVMEALDRGVIGRGQRHAERCDRIVRGGRAVAAIAALGPGAIDISTKRSGSPRTNCRAIRGSRRSARPGTDTVARQPQRATKSRCGTGCRADILVIGRSMDATAIWEKFDRAHADIAPPVRAGTAPGSLQNDRSFGDQMSVSKSPPSSDCRSIRATSDWPAADGLARRRAPPAHTAGAGSPGRRRASRSSTMVCGL